MSDGNSQSDGNTQGLSAPEILSHVGGPFEPTAQVLDEPVAYPDPFMRHPVMMHHPEGSVMANHHVLHPLPTTEPAQDYAGARDMGAQ